jgi:hypothetical protein
MTTRETAAQRAAREAETAAANSAGNGLPEAWGTDVQEFFGHNLTDKIDLIGTPMLLIGAEIERTEGKTYDVAFIYALDEKGTEFEFSDTTETGCRGQVQAILAEQGLNPAPGGGFQKLSPRVVVRRGLRFSDFTIRDEETGKKREARTYYLSAAGRNPNETPKNDA